MTLNTNWRVRVDDDGQYHLEHNKMTKDGRVWMTEATTANYRALCAAVSRRGAGTLPEDKAEFLKANAVAMPRDDDGAEDADGAEPWDF